MRGLDAAVEELLILLSCSFSQTFAVQITFPSSKLSLYMRRSGPPSGTWFLGPIWIHTPNGISIGSAVFAALKIGTDLPTDRQTDHATLSVTIGRIYVVVRCSLIKSCAVL